MSPIRISLGVYLLAVAVLAWTYPVLPRRVIDAGPYADVRIFSPSGRTFVTIDGSTPKYSDGLWVWSPTPVPEFVRFWDTDTGSLRSEIALGLPIYGISLSADLETRRAWDEAVLGRTVSFSSDKDRVFVGKKRYDSETGEQLPGTHDPDAEIGNEIKSPDGTLRANLPLKTGGISYSHRMRFVEMANGQVRFSVPGASAAAFRPDGRQLAVAVDLLFKPEEDETGFPEFYTPFAARGGVRLYDPSSGDIQGTLAEWDGEVGSIAYTPDGKKLAVSLQGKLRGQASVETQTRVEIWDVETGQCERTLRCEPTEVPKATEPEDPFPPESPFNHSPIALSAPMDLRFLAEGRVLVSVVASSEFFTPAHLATSDSELIWDLTLSTDEPMKGPHLQLSTSGELLVRVDRDAEDEHAELVGERLGLGRTEILWRRPYARDVNVSPSSFTRDGRCLVYLGLPVTKPSRILSWLAPVARHTPFRKLCEPVARLEIELLDAENGALLTSFSFDQMPTTIPSPDDGTLLSCISGAGEQGKLTLWELPTRGQVPWRRWGAILAWSFLPALPVGLLQGWWLRRKGATAAPVT